MTSMRESSRACSMQMSAVRSSHRSTEIMMRASPYVWDRAHRMVRSMNASACQAGTQIVMSGIGRLVEELGRVVRPAGDHHQHAVRGFERLSRPHAGFDEDRVARIQSHRDVIRISLSQLDLDPPSCAGEDLPLLAVAVFAASYSVRDVR